MFGVHLFLKIMGGPGILEDLRSIGVMVSKEGKL